MRALVPGSLRGAPFWCAVLSLALLLCAPVLAAPAPKPTAPAKTPATAAGGKRVPLAPGRGRRVSLDVRNISVRTVLAVLGDGAQARFTIAPDVRGTVSYNRRDLALEDMLDAILPPIGLRWARIAKDHYLVERAVDAGTGRALLEAPRGWERAGLEAIYYNDRTPELPDGTLSALLAVLPEGVTPVKRQHSLIAFLWREKGPAPGVEAAHWSARWTGRLWVPADDSYTFSFETESGAALLMLDGKVVLDAWQAPGRPTGAVGSPVKLTRGWHEATIEYHQVADKGALSLFWQASWLPRELVPPYGKATPPAKGEQE